MKIIGRLEKVSFPEFGLTDLVAKVDTGAYTSSIHCHDMAEVELEGHKCLSFKLLDPDHPQYHDHIYIAHEYKVRTVKSSNGMKENRYAIKTRISLCGKLVKIELTLSERSNMRYPILLGRRFLSRRFLVNSSGKYLAAVKEGEELKPIKNNPKKK